MTVAAGLVRPKRISLVEYGEPVDAIGKTSLRTSAERARVRELLLAAGERVAAMLRLPSNPVLVGAGGVRVGGVAGLLRVSPTVELEIAPKFLGGSDRWREDFFFLSTLSRHGRLLPSEHLASASGAREDLSTLVARTMVTMFWENHRRPLRTYHRSRVVDFAIDGDVDAETLVLPTTEGYEQELITYDRRNSFNATIVSAVDSLLPEVRNPSARRQLSRIAEGLRPQRRLPRARPSRVPSRSRRWQPLYDLAVEVVNGFGVSYAVSTARSPGFIVDTWRVWEDLLALGLRLARGGQCVRTQRSLPLGRRILHHTSGGVEQRPVSVTPDVTIVDERGVPALLVDAKYKGRISDLRTRIDEADLYEALAFASASKCPRVILAYPAVARSGLEREVGTTAVFETIVVGGVTVVGMEIEVRTISRRGGLRLFANNLGKGL